MTTTTKTNSSRAEQLRQRRATQKSPTAPTPRQTTRQTSKPAFRPQTVYLPGDLHQMPARPMTKPAGKKKQGRMATVVGGSHRRAEPRGYDVAFSVGRADVRTPVLTIPRLGPRWVSGGLTLLLAFMLYTMWTASTFSVSAAEVTGNERLTAEDIYSGLGVAGQPIFKAVPAQIETNLRTAYPDLASVKVQVSFPNKVSVQIVERVPALLWYQDGKTTWIDTNGIAFLPRGEAEGLIPVSSTGSPAGIIPDPKKSLFEQVFIQPEMVKAILALAPYLPKGISMTYDPQYGMGWQDPRGWSVYFGQNIDNIQMKLQVYQSMVDSFIRQGIQPTLISVEYLDAPFYK